MKRNLLCALLTLLFSMYETKVYGYDFVVNGIYYNYDSYNNKARVSSGEKKYKGEIVIPSSVTYNGRELDVYVIDSKTFYECKDMTAVSLPNTIEIIYDNVFYGCSKLETVKIPSSVTTIGKNAFYGCSSLKSLIIEDGDTEITHYNNDSYDDRNTFSPKYIYYGRNATTSYYNDFFLNLGNNNESVQVLSFGPKVSYVAPVSFPNLKIIYCMNEEPASKGFNGGYFGGSAYANAVLYVPTGSKEKYASNYFWGKFFNIQEMDINNMWRGIGDPNTNNTSNQKCKKPTISYHNGKFIIVSKRV